MHRLLWSREPAVLCNQAPPGSLEAIPLVRFARLPGTDCAGFAASEEWYSLFLARAASFPHIRGCLHDCRVPRTDGAHFVSQFAVCVLRAGVRADVDLFLYRRLRADTGRLAVGGRLELARGVRSGIGGACGYVPRRGPLGRDRAPS